VLVLTNFGESRRDTASVGLKDGVLDSLDLELGPKVWNRPSTMPQHDIISYCVIHQNMRNNVAKKIRPFISLYLIWFGCYTQLG